MILLFTRSNTFLKYFISGSFAFLVHLSFIIVSVEFFGFNKNLSSSLGFLIASMFHYIIQYYWAFKSEKIHKEAFLNYIISLSFSFFVNLIIFYILYNFFRIDYKIAQTLCILVIFPTNYFLSKKFIFSKNSIY